MSHRRLLLIAVSGLALASASPAWTQAPPPASAAAVVAEVRPSDPWPQTISDIPADPSVKFGLLANGMRYAIMRNATPPGQASLRMRIDAGSLMETDEQRGLAHFMEHMAFNGTTGVPEGQLLPMLERLGLSFGADTNAVTSFDETVYKLDLPRTDAETVDSALMILREMAGEATLEADAIDRERGIILSEERTRDGPALRSLRARLDFLMRDQLTPRRLPIGDTSVLQTAPRERFVAFYDAFYRPSRTTLIAVGDFDPAEMEAKIRARFGDWSADAPDGAEPVIGPVAERGPEAAVFVDPGVQPSVQIAWVSPPEDSADTLDRQRRNWIRSLGFSVLNRRFQSLARGAEPPFAGASGARSTDFDTVDAASLFAATQPGEWAKALTALEQERRRILEHGVGQAELNREITEVRTALTNGVAAANTRRTPALAEGFSAAVNADAVIVSPQTRLAIFESVVDGLTAAEVDAALTEAFQGSGPLIFVTSPTAVDGGEAAVMTAYEASAATPVAAPEAAAAQDWPYADFGAPGAVAERREVADIETTFVTFQNGVRLTVKPTTFRDSQVMVSVRAGQGFQSVRPNASVPLWAIGAAWAEGGLSRLTAEQIEAVLSGRTYGATAAAGEDSFLLSGITRPEDLTTQLQLLTAYLTDAAWRAEPFERTRRLYAQALPQLDATPGGVFSRENAALLRSGDSRWAFPTAQGVASADLAALQAAVDATLDRGPVEVIVVGDVETDAVIQAVAATLGALPARADAAPIDPAAETVRFPSGGVEPVVLTHGGRADQGLAFVAWPTVDMIADPAEARRVRLLSDILSLRLIEELREGQGVTYSPSVGATASSNFEGYGYLSAAIEAPPEKLAGFFADVDRIVADLVARPVEADELERARRPRIEALRRSRQTNEFWMGELQDAQTDPARLPALRSAEADLERATPETLQATAARYLTPDRAYRIEVRPRAVQ